MSRPLDALPMDEAEFPRTRACLRAGVDEGVAPGFVAAVWTDREPGAMRVHAEGARRLMPGYLPMFADTVFDLASVTKVMGTATLAARLVDRGWIDWSTPLSALLPGWTHREVRLSHLLSHTAGLIWWEAYWERLRARFAPRPVWSVPVAERQAAMRELVLAARPEARPGERAVYSDLSFLLLGFALEEVTGLPLDEAVRRHVWQPMGLPRAHYHRITRDLEADRRLEVAATEDCPWRGGVLQGQVHDDNCWAMGGYGGHAGAFGTAEDVLRFARALLEGFLSPATLAAAWGRVPGAGGRTLGWDSPSAEGSSAGRHFPAASAGHLGFTGTSLWIDPVNRVAVTLLSNRVHPSRENVAIKAFRPRLHDALREDLRDARGVPATARSR